jgi:hypothetical protein
LTTSLRPLTVVEAEHQAGLRLLAVGLQRAGAAVDVGNPEFLAGLGERRRGGAGGEQGGREAAGDEGSTRHGFSSEGRVGRPGRGLWQQGSGHPGQAVDSTGERSPGGSGEAPDCPESGQFRGA